MCYMKHAASSRKPIAKPKSITKKPALKYAVETIKLSDKKRKGVVSAQQNLNLKPTKKIASKKPVQTVKTITKKAESPKSARTVKLKVVEKIKPTVAKAETDFSAKKIKSVRETNKAIANKGDGKTNLKKAKPVISSKLNKPKNQTLKSSASIKKAQTAEVSKKPNASARLPKTLAEKIKPAVSVASSNTKSMKSLTVGKVKKGRFVKPQSTVSVIKAKLPAKSQTSVSVKKSKSENVKASATVKKAKSKIEKTIKNKVQTPKLSNTIKTNLRKSKANSPVRKVKSTEKKIKLKNVKPLLKVSKRISVKRVENKVEPTKLPVLRKAVKKKTKPISSAIFRGKKDRYDFQVFPIDAEFEDVSAIYIISKRKIDKRKKAHHALVCIGQTDSILGEMKRHKKGKCVKQHQANAISILLETNEKTRLKIETDLKAAHVIPCVHA